MLNIGWMFFEGFHNTLQALVSPNKNLGNKMSNVASGGLPILHYCGRG